MKFGGGSRCTRVPSFLDVRHSSHGSLRTEFPFPEFVYRADGTPYMPSDRGSPQAGSSLGHELFLRGQQRRIEPYDTRSSSVRAVLHEHPCGSLHNL